jgi:hypothetical protein
MEAYMSQEDSIANWDEARTSLMTGSITKEDDLDNWLDAINVDLAAPYLTETFADDIGNLADGVDTRWLQYEIQLPNNDLNNWNDSVNKSLDAFSPDLTRSFADDLDSWTDDRVSLMEAYLTRDDDLDNWNDAENIAQLGFYSYPNFADDLDSWSDDFDSFLEHFLSVSDDLDSWTDRWYFYSFSGIQNSSSSR